ncbi:deoxyribonuclease V [Actinomadura terrae]|uniref:deoxyribonuclease V n=1 Tax=Actinomadura terrae TaxID=604353 RepID=UPI001FA7E5E6|nr:deoxyribonuclease V [Actinomadura terrae]
MEVRDLHPWPATASEAEAIQDELRPLLVDSPGPPSPRTIAGLDVSYTDDGPLAAAVVVLETTTLNVLEESVATGTAAFPYIPGLLAFRELPTLIEALRALEITPDLLVCDGYGLAHPRRFGLACHLGVLTDLPTIGVAKTSFIGTHTPPAPQRGATSPLLHQGEEVGRALRTQDNVKPVFVSVGHRMNLDNACRNVLKVARHRLPETTRRADRLSRDALSGA